MLSLLSEYKRSLLFVLMGHNVIHFCRIFFISFLRGSKFPLKRYFISLIWFILRFFFFEVSVNGSMSLISFINFLVVYTETIDLTRLILYFATLLNLFIILESSCRIFGSLTIILWHLQRGMVWLLLSWLVFI